jgi:hypothetical protein
MSISFSYDQYQKLVQKAQNKREQGLEQLSVEELNLLLHATTVQIHSRLQKGYAR